MLHSTTLLDRNQAAKRSSLLIQMLHIVHVLNKTMLTKPNAHAIWSHRLF